MSPREMCNTRLKRSIHAYYIQIELYLAKAKNNCTLLQHANSDSSYNSPPRVIINPIPPIYASRLIPLTVLSRVIVAHPC